MTQNDMQLTSAAFAHNDALPAKHTKEGENLSPALSWSNIPEGTKTLAIVFDAAEAPEGHNGPWDHWMLFNLPAGMDGIEEGIAQQFDPMKQVGHGINSYGNSFYDGPGPAKEGYSCFFTLYALSNRVNVKPGIGKAALMRAMEPLVLAKATLTARYEP